MIKKQNRLSANWAVSKTIQRGSVYKSLNLTCRILENQKSEPVKVTVVVSKKVSNKANIRNKIKRRVREAVGSKIEGKIGYSLVVFPKASVLDISFEELLKEVDACLEGR